MSIEEAIVSLQDIVNTLTETYHRPFTLDGHLVGSLGEVYARDHYGLTLLPPGAEIHDAVTGDGRMVQIKTTQRDSVGIYAEPDWLLVLKMHEDGSMEEAYYGPGARPWELASKMTKTGQRHISLKKLRELHDEGEETGSTENR